MTSVNLLAKRIFKARKEAHLSQQSLAQAIGVSDKSISAYEQARANPPLNKLKKIASVTSHSLNYFTDINADQGTIANKLSKVERELKEIKKLLKKAS